MKNNVTKIDIEKVIISKTILCDYNTLKALLLLKFCTQ